LVDLFEFSYFVSENYSQTEIFTILGYLIAQNDFLLQIISGQTISPILNSKAIKEDPSKIEKVGYVETSLTVYQYTLCDTQKGEDLVCTAEEA
jgi:hypothetical protein